MKLIGKDVELYYKLHPALLTYVNQKLKIINPLPTVQDISSLPLEEKVKIRDALYDQIDLVDSFIEQNPYNFSAPELEIIFSWKNFVRGTFCLFRYLKKYAIFLDTDSPPKAYGVLALWDRFDEILGPHLPILLKTVLLPFKGQIIYDGIMSPYPLIFGPNTRRDIADAYEVAKSKFGVITSLPFSREEVKESEAKKLKFYLKSDRNRHRYWEEIQELISKDPNLLVLYHQEMGKIQAQGYRKQLHEIGFTDVWFAILEGMVIASGKTREEIERILQGILPAGKEKFVYLFRLN